MKKRIVFYCSIFFFLSLLPLVSGQTPGMWHITDSDGLPSQTIYHTTQDLDGYIWVATSNGLCRFDGKEFKTYKNTALKDNEILKVEMDPLGRIWLKNLSGQLFYIEKDSIYNAKNLIKDVHLVNDFIINDQAVWLCFRKEDTGTERNFLANLSFDKEGKFAPLFIYESSYSKISSFVRDDSSVYVLKYNSGDPFLKITQLDKHKKILIDKDSIFSKRALAFTLFFIHQGQSYLQMQQYRNKSLLKKKQHQLVPFLDFKHPSSINNILTIDNSFWLQTRKGIYILPYENQNLEKKQHLLPNTTINHLMVDKEGNKWISTANQGLYVITSPQIRVFQKSNYPFPNDKVYSLKYDEFQNHLLVGHGEGKISIIDHQLNNRTLSIHSSGRTVDILIDHQENKWFANDPNLIILGPDFMPKNKVIHYPKRIFERKNKGLIIGTAAYTLALTSAEARSFQVEINKLSEKILHKRTYAIQEDFLGNIWLGTTKGIFIYRDTIHPYLENGTHQFYNVSSMTQTPDSTIWVATRGDGLIGIKNRKVLYRYHEKNGLPSNTINKIFSTTDQLWVGTDNGLNKLELKTNKWEHINTAHGLPSNTITAIEIVDDQVWIGTPKGLVNFKTNTIHSNLNPPQVYITTIQIEEKDTLVLDSFMLPPDKNSIQIEFAGIGFKGKGAMHYQYKMSGIDENWVNTESRFARYPKLEPGQYNFEVFAINNDQIKSPKAAQATFIIYPPWWQTWWARLLGLLGLVGIGAILLNIKLQRQKQEQQYLNHVNDLKARSLRSQMNPHFIFNSMNAIQQFLTNNNREQAMNYLSSFGKLIRLIFEQSQYEKITLEEELEFLNLYLRLEQLRFMEEIDIQLKVSPELLEISDEIHLPPLLIQPVIENSFKHGFLFKEGPGKLKVDFYCEGAYLICTIEDNGVGQKKALELGQKPLKDRPSSGLKTAKERVQINNLGQHFRKGTSPGITIIDLYDEHKLVKGTRVILKIHSTELAQSKN